MTQQLPDLNQRARDLRRSGCCCPPRGYLDCLRKSTAVRGLPTRGVHPGGQSERRSPNRCSLPDGFPNQVCKPSFQGV